jgi:hypothetical protein
MGGTMVGVIGATIRDAAQQRNEKTKRRADKFEELVAAIYEYDHWLDTLRHRDAFGSPRNFKGTQSGPPLQRLT